MNLQIITLFMIYFICCEPGAATDVVDYEDGFRPQQALSRVLRSVANENFIFDEFGSSYGLNRTQLQNLMTDLGIGQVDKNLGPKANKCITADDVFSVHGYENSNYLNSSSFQTVCPTLLKQIIKKSCPSKKKNQNGVVTKKKVDSAKAWGFGVLSVTIISLASMLGAFVVPFMNKEFYRKILLAMVSMAVGVLGGSGLFHLMPHTFGLGGDGDIEYLWKCSVIVGGIYFFFITESLMKMYIRFADWKKRKHNQSRGDENHANNPLNSPEAMHMAIIDGVHDIHALDSVHVSDDKCEHEHGIDSLNMAGDHCINKKDAREYFHDDNSTRCVGIIERVAPVAWMIILGDGLHNFIDGLAIGVSFTNNIVEGISTSLAIFCEELPHELGDFAILLNSGLSYKQAILANFLSACTCYIGMIIGTILGSTTHIVQWIYALAAGMFLYISLVDMLPEATGMQVTISASSKKETIKNFLIVNVAMIVGYTLMLLLAIYSGNIQI